MTFEAKQAIREIQTHLFGIDGEMEFLTEPALKGFAFEARRLAKDDFDKGGGNVGRVYFVRRLSRQSFGFRVAASSGPIPKAPGSAGGYLPENAKYFSAESSVEARVVCDLEWDDAAFGDDEE